jgi:hypothetical protein
MTFRQRGNAQAGYKGYNYDNSRRVTQTDPPRAATFAGRRRISTSPHCAWLLKRFNDNQVLALAGYKAETQSCVTLVQSLTERYRSHRKCRSPLSVSFPTDSPPRHPHA